MFGYVVCNEKELKGRELDLYRSYYCGFCSVLKTKYGSLGQLTLSYDTTFLILLLTGLYEPQETDSETTCIAHPFEKHPTRVNSFSEYAADMNIILSYYSLLDDWSDEKKLKGLVLSRLLAGREKKACLSYADKEAVIRDRLIHLHECEEKKDQDIDRVSGLFGDIMAEILACREDEWEEVLRRMGFFLGKFVYIMDAYDDLEKDRKNGSYNPLLKAAERPDYEDYVRQILTMMMAECCKTFETLPILQNADILRNILYSGVWSRYGQLQQQRERK